MKTVKTNAMRLLDRNKIKYSVSLYEHNGNEAVDGISVANCLNEDPNKVLKLWLPRQTPKSSLSLCFR